MAELDARAGLRSQHVPVRFGSLTKVRCKNGPAWRDEDLVGESPTLIYFNWGCSSVVEKTISFEILPRKSVD